MRPRTRIRATIASLLLAAWLGGMPLWADPKPAPDRKYVLIKALLLKNFAKDMNGLAPQGFRLKLVTIQDAQAVAVMERTATPGAAPEYRVVSFISTKRINAAAADGFRVVPRSLQIDLHYAKDAGHTVNLIVLAKDSGETAQYEYQVLTASGSKLEAKIADAARDGWELVDVSSIEA